MNDSEIIKALTTSSDPNNLNCQPTTKLCKEALDLIKRQQAEIERLNSMNQAKLDMIHDVRAELETAKSEAVREFAEKLKEYCNEITNQEWNKRTLPVSWADAYEDFIDDIDRLLEETGCNDGNNS